MNYNDDDDIQKELEVGKLESYYSEGETCDSDVFAEMRSNILIMNGKHYERTVGRGLSRNLRDMDVKKSRRIRLVKNHTQKAVNDLKDTLASMVPDVLPYPVVENELRHQKAAEIARQVLKCGKEKNNWSDFVERSLDNFMELGEVACKIYWHPLKGGIKGFRQKVEVMGDQSFPVFKGPNGEVTLEPFSIDIMGQQIPHEPVPDETKADFYGQTVIERIPAFDLLRCKSARDMNESPWLIYRKMISNDILKGLIKRADKLSDEEKQEALDKIKGSHNTTFRVFNSGSGSFEEKEGHSLLKEIYFRQSPKYPKGYFVIWTDYGKLFEGTIPFGEFGEVSYPIKWEGNERFESSARGFSPIKRVRPSQIEVNRCASKITEHQLTIGDDKVILNKGSKFERGIDQPGIRTYYTTGTAQVIPGRAGEQFVNYLEHNISEIYRLLNVPENKNPTAQAFDPKAEIYKMQRQKIIFTKPAGKFERYLKSVATTYLFLEQKYMDEERFANLLGPENAGLFAEFEQINRLDYMMKLEEVSADLESQMGKVIELETILQYAGKNLDDQTMNSLLSQFPILNRHHAFKHITIDLKNIESDILALERGQYVGAGKYDNHEMYIKMLVDRMKQKDFPNLSPEIQQMFEQKKMEHEQVLQQAADEIRDANAGMVPSGGALVRCDVYRPSDPNDPTKVRRLQLPQDALEWLEKRLGDQGLLQERLSEIADMQTQAQIMAGQDPSMGMGQPMGPTDEIIQQMSGGVQPTLPF
jgi:hypothetical protein